MYLWDYSSGLYKCPFTVHCIVVVEKMLANRKQRKTQVFIALIVYCSLITGGDIVIIQAPPYTQPASHTSS